jgi:hypothetical protein
MKKAEKGDRARFVFASREKIFGIIEYIPVATGDSWIITEINEGQKLGTVYIQQFDMMFLC